jgi:hypothetical protein
MALTSSLTKLGVGATASSIVFQRLNGTRRLFTIRQRRQIDDES